MENVYPPERLGRFTLSALIGGENWGHVLSDNMFGIFTRFSSLARILEPGPRSGGRWGVGRDPGNIALPQNHTTIMVTDCNTSYPHHMPGWHIPAGRYTTACKRHVEVLSDAMGVTAESLPRDGGISCFEHLVVGSAAAGARIMEAGRMDIISSSGPANGPASGGGLGQQQVGAHEVNQSKRVDNRGATAVEAYRDHILRGMGRDPEYVPSTESIVLVVKRREDSRIYQNWKNRQQLIQGLENRSRTRAVVRQWIVTPNTTFEEQLDILSNTTTLVMPGGGVAFMLYFLPKRQNVIIWPYGWQEALQFSISKMWLSSVQAWEPRVEERPELCGRKEYPTCTYDAWYPANEMAAMYENVQINRTCDSCSCTCWLASPGCACTRNNDVCAG